MTWQYHHSFISINGIFGFLSSSRLGVSSYETGETLGVANSGKHTVNTLSPRADQDITLMASLASDREFLFAVE